jgi:hypothetical protein
MTRCAQSASSARAIALSLATVAAVWGCAGGESSLPAPLAGGPGDGGGTGGVPTAGPGIGSMNPGDACAGLAPSFGPAVEALIDAGSPAGDCALATANPAGQVALGIAGTFANMSGIAIHLRSPANAVLGAIPMLTPVPFGGGSLDTDPWFHWAGSGYHAIVYDLGAFAPLVFRTFRAYDTSGLQLAGLGQFAVSSAPDGQGGSVLLAQTFQRSLSSGGRSHAPQYVPIIGPMLLERVDAAGAITRSVEIGGNPRFVLVNPATGHVVAVGAGAAAPARWFDATGQPLTPWFTAGNVAGTSMHLLLDGTAVLSDDGRWDVALQDGVSNPVAVPDWLATRPFTRLATIRGGRGYAVLPMDATTADVTYFEIVTASGQSCGTFAVPAPTAGATESINPRRLDVGQDGTLLQQLSKSAPSTGGVQCMFRWWPALLR